MWFPSFDPPKQTAAEMSVSRFQKSQEEKRRIMVGSDDKKKMGSLSILGIMSVLGYFDEARKDAKDKSFSSILSKEIPKLCNLTRSEKFFIRITLNKILYESFSLSNFFMFTFSKRNSYISLRPGCIDKCNGVFPF